jgi:hypothetical protein
LLAPAYPALVPTATGSQIIGQPRQSAAQTRFGFERWAVSRGGILRSVATRPRVAKRQQASTRGTQLLCTPSHGAAAAPILPSVAAQSRRPGRLAGAGFVRVEIDAKRVRQLIGGEDVQVRPVVGAGNAREARSGFVEKLGRVSGGDDQAIAVEMLRVALRAALPGQS